MLQVRVTHLELDCFMGLFIVSRRASSQDQSEIAERFDDGEVAFDR
ncbi:hypothetical protein [Nocardia asteroides]